MARATIPFLVLVAFALFFATYNTVTMIVHHSNKLGHSNLDIMDEVKDHSSSFIDSVVKMPRLVGATTKMHFHVALTSTDAPYTKWQCRIMYYWYKRFKDQPGSEMGEFTRVLHSGRPDNIMNEIPTVVVDPLPPGSDRVPRCLPFTRSLHSGRLLAQMGVRSRPINEKGPLFFRSTGDLI